MANEKRLIYAEDAMKWIRESKVPETGAFTKGVNKGLNVALSTLGNNEVLPTVDAVEVVHGRWIPLEYDGYADGNPVWDLWECSECQEEHSGDEDTLTPYCPNCGAKMDGGNEDG